MSKSRRQQPIFHGYHGWGAVVLSALLLSPTIAARTFLSALLREVAPTSASSQQNRTAPPPTEAAQTPRRAEDDEHALAVVREDDRRDPHLDADPDAETAPRAVATATVRNRRAHALVSLAHAALLAAAQAQTRLAPVVPAFLPAPPAPFGDRAPVLSRALDVRAALPPRAPPLVFAA